MKSNQLFDIDEFSRWLSIESNYLPTGKTEWLPDYRLINLLDLLTNVEKFVFDVLKTKKPAFEFKLRKNHNDLPPLKTVVRHALSEYFRQVISWYEAYDPQYRYSPYTQLFFSCCAALPLTADFINPNRNAAARHKAYRLFNDLIEFIRKEARSPEFKRIQYDLEYNSDRIYRGAVKYIRRLFQSYAKLLVMRVDFHYIKEYADKVTVDKCQHDFAHFLNNLRHNKELSQNMAGDLPPIIVPRASS